MSLTLISRRTAIKAGIGAATAVQLGGLPARGAEPKRGGFARIATNDGSQTDSLDPITWPGSFTGSALGGALCNNLTEILPDRSISGLDHVAPHSGCEERASVQFFLKDAFDVRCPSNVEGASITRLPEASCDKIWTIVSAAA